MHTCVVQYDLGDLCRVRKISTWQIAMEVCDARLSNRNLRLSVLLAMSPHFTLYPQSPLF